MSGSDYASQTKSMMSKKQKLLGIYIDENLRWTDHIDQLYANISSKMSLLRQFSTYIPTEAQKRADLLALVCGVYCELVTFPLVSWVRCGTWLYRFLIFAPLLTFYQGYILPLIGYGSNILGTTSRSNLDRLSRLQKRATRFILNALFDTASFRIANYRKMT